MSPRIALALLTLASFSPTQLHAEPAAPSSPTSVLGPLQVMQPRDGAVVGSPTIDVVGRLAASFNQAGTTVTVNGQSATVLIDGSRAGGFRLDNFELNTGVNSLTVEAITPQGAVLQQDVQVTLSRLTSNNVEIDTGRAYAARGANGFAIMDLKTREFETFAAPGATGRVDDLAIADGFLFLLDAASPGNLSVMSLADPEQPVLVSGPVVVPVGPFAGVDAAAGRVVVSGGTSLLTVRSYNASGTLGASVATIDLGIGQPDVLLADDGQRAFVSTDFSGFVGGSSFGISTIALNDRPSTPTLLSRTGLPGAGFSSGFQSPANFPIESALVGDVLVTAHGGGLSRVNSNGGLLGTTPRGFFAVNVDADGDTAFVVGTNRSLATIDVSNIASPVVESVESFAGPGTFTSVAANGFYCAIASNAGGLRVLRR